MKKTFFAMALTFFLMISFYFISCKDDKNSTEDFSSSAEANTEAQTNTDMITQPIEDVSSVSEMSTDFDGTALMKMPGLSKTKKLNTYSYNSSTGYWTYDTTYTTSGYTYDFLFKVKFTPNTAGYPDTNTNQMEYSADFGFSGTESNYTYDYTYKSDMDITGIKDFSKGTGNLVINGSSSADFDFDYTENQTTFSYKYSYSNDISDVKFEKNNPYPKEGIISFTLGRDLDPNSPAYPDITVAGKITFDGDNTADLEFGGYNFTINLDTGTITLNS